MSIGPIGPFRSARIACQCLALLLAAVSWVALMPGAASGSTAYAGAVAWGGNGTGQLGDGTNTGPEVCALSASAPCSIVPVAVGGLSEARSVAAGGYHGLALLGDGTVMAWGGNSGGQLGAGEVVVSGPYRSSEEVVGPQACETGVTGPPVPCSTTPVAVSGLSEVRQVAAGEAFSLALLRNGTVKAWGRNWGGIEGAGVLGNLTTQMSAVPVVVEGLSEVVAIAAGADYALALLKDGTVMAWGDDSSGQLGDAGNEAEGFSDVPVAVGGLSEVVAIAAGRGHSLALLKDGTVMAWGANGAGQLGDGTRTASDIPVAVSGISEATAVAAGERSSFALLKDGTVMAWGENEVEGAEGALGDGTATSSDVPVAVCAVGETAPCAQHLSGVTAIAAGSRHTLALLGNGTVVAWGESYRGLLGDGYQDITPQGGVVGNDVPVPVDGLSEATAISAGENLSLAIGTLAPLPTVTGLDPRSGAASGGTSVRITGSNLADVTAVRFGSTTASFTIDSETEITAIAPPGTGMTFIRIPGENVTPPGSVYVTVQTAAGPSPASTWGDTFAYGLPEAEAPAGGGGGESGGLGGPSGLGGSGVGMSALGHPVVSVTPTALTRAQKLAKALKQCEKDKSKTRRATCDKQARRQYATAARNASRRKRRH